MKEMKTNQAQFWKEIKKSIIVLEGDNNDGCLTDQRGSGQWSGKGILECSSEFLLYFQDGEDLNHTDDNDRSNRIQYLINMYFIVIDIFRVCILSRSSVVWKQVERYLLELVAQAVL